MECHEERDLDCLDLYEYCHYVNIGHTMNQVMTSIAYAGGGKNTAFKV